jgi:hypothetical protein
MPEQTVGDKEKSLAVPDTINFTTEQRIEFLANLIVARILEDKANDYILLKDLEKVSS